MISANPVLATPADLQPAVASPAAPEGAVVPSPFTAVGGGPPLLDPALLRSEPSADQVQAWWDGLVAAGLDVRQPAALLVSLEAILLSESGLQGQELMDNLRARAALVRELVGLALARLGPALAQAGAVAGALPVISPIVDYVTGRESLLSSAFNVQGDVGLLLAPALPGLGAATAVSGRLAGFLTSEDPGTQQIRANALEFAAGVGDGIRSSKLVQEPGFPQRFLDHAVAKSQELHVFLPTVVDAGLLYGIFVQPLVDIAGLISLVFSDLVGLIETLSHLLTAALSNPIVARQLGFLLGEQQANSLYGELLEPNAARFHFNLASKLGELVSDTVLSAVGATVLVVVGKRAVRVTATAAKVAGAISEVADELPASAKGRQRVIETLRELGDGYQDRWRRLVDLAQGSETAMRGVERLLGRDDLRKLLDDLAEFLGEVEKELLDFQAMAAKPDEVAADWKPLLDKSNGELELRQASVLRLLERMAGMAEVELSGIAVYRRLWVEDGPPRGIARPFTEATGSSEWGKLRGNQDIIWYELLDDPARISSIVGDHPIVEELFVLLGELDPVSNGRGLYSVLVNFWGGGNNTWGATGVLYTGRKLARELAGTRSRLDFEIAKGSTSTGDRRELDIVVDYVEDETLGPEALNYLLAGEVKNVTSISAKLRGQIAKDLIRHIVGGDLDFVRLRWFLPQDQFVALSSQLAAAFRKTLWDQSVVDAMFEVNVDPNDVAQRLDAALTAGRLIDSFDVSAPVVPPSP